MKKSAIVRILALTLIVFILLGVFGPTDRSRANGATSNASASFCPDGKALVMGTSPDYPPYENVDAKHGGDIVGLDIDIAKAITSKLGCKLEISAMDFNGLIAALQTHRVDFVMSGMSVTPERKENVDFSNPYYAARNTIVSKKKKPFATLQELEGGKVGVQLGSTQETAIAGLKNAKITKLNTISSLIQELKANRIDAAIVEDAVAIGYIEANADLAFTMIPSDDDAEGYAIAFPKGSSLVAPFNAELAELESSGEKQKMIDSWFGQHEGAKKGNQLNLDFSILNGYVGYIVKGTLVTLLFTLVSALLGFVWGSILSLFKISSVRPLQWFATVYTSVFRGTPLLLQLFIIYYATPQLFDYDIPALLAAGLAFGLNSAAYLSETIRGGIMAVDRGQREAAMALGIPYRTMMRSIILPQAVKNILPALVNECVALLKESSLVSVIGVQDLMRRANVVQASTFRAFEALLFAGAIYYCLVLILTSLAHLLERRLRRSD
ncbi:polar amino acid ABC transporter, inner membrane subunit [Paenibacillus curdlanolyticus YK9]|uniref:Polar amino acid ABC transporter, inner membrane subunit n=1 Tax=Paenibacillus curdlanolyticus YK9 TaxID=717606 RepID=E0I740_9BACL|nr:ABC transporter substrate-binding protein/permease [Paenibacillus curdlanolyticus]EFM11856.1 polar amino acid ABC transporter, inner membrane subunit [Paenibacillus curdlanolyticus YK9]